ncbi:helix-turn-helix transcriptional regulator [Sphaerisporangium sp. NPDC088356]|uniref:helix-turn-helix transcriptional regulator n=1 Tax=Sphaerisporangium sp. NPDC088356 TaxID=3154871 RepID=UPI0034161D53
MIWQGHRLKRYARFVEVRTFPEALKAIMEQQGWTQVELARELGVSQAWVSEVSRGQKDTGMARAIGLLARVGWEVRISPKMEESVERREFLAAAASVVFVPSTRANPYQDADYVHTLAASLARNRYELGGIPLVSSALGHARRIEQVLHDTVRDKALQTAASQLADQVTLVLYDAGSLVQADRVGGLALELARRAGDHESQARAYDTLSRVSLDRGDHARGVTYAQRGLQMTDITNGQRASLSMRLGRSLAFIPGQETASRDILDHALNVGGLSPFGEAALVGDVAIGLGHLHAYGEAGTLLSEAAEAIGQWSPLFRAQYLGRQVQTAMRASDLSLAADRMHKLARALPFVTSGRVNKRVGEILKASQTNAAPEIRQAREHLRAMISPAPPPST